MKITRYSREIAGSLGRGTWYMLFLARAIGKIVKRPWFVNAPAFMIRFILGDLGPVILEGQRAVPKMLLK